MTKYTVSTFDVCAEGNERLRSYSKFILVAYVSSRISRKDIKAQWLADIQACDRGDDFDFDAARKCVEDYCKTLPLSAFVGCNGCNAYLYVNVENAHFPVY